MQNSAFIAYNQDFILFGDQHWYVLLLTLFSCYVLPVLAKRYLSARQQLHLYRALISVLSFWVISYILILLLLGDFDLKTDLPLDICNLTALLLPILMWNPTIRVHEILYFWIFAGTLQAVVTPHLFNGFPNFIFLKYWFVHSGLIVSAVYATYVFNLKPTFSSIWKSFLALQGYMLFVFIMNAGLGSNYVYLMHKPPTASLLDYLGPWPLYILVGEILGLFLFILVWLPLKLRACLGF